MSVRTGPAAGIYSFYPLLVYKKLSWLDELDALVALDSTSLSTSVFAETIKVKVKSSRLHSSIYRSSLIFVWLWGNKIRNPDLYLINFRRALVPRDTERYKTPHQVENCHTKTKEAEVGVTSPGKSSAADFSSTFWASTVQTDTMRSLKLIWDVLL